MRLTTAILLFSLLVFMSTFTKTVLAAEASKDLQIITRSGSQASYKGPAEYFTGAVRVDPLFTANAAASFGSAYVTFEPGARTAWHTHPAGQRLIVTSGAGLIQLWGSPMEEVRSGDVVWFPPGIKHWHGASPTESMTHIALTGLFDGKSVEWLEKVSDEQYGKWLDSTQD